MNTELLDRITAADPAREAVSLPNPDELRRRVLAQAPPPPRRRLSALPALVVAVAAAAALVLPALLGSRVDVVDRAHAALTDGGAILHYTIRRETPDGDAVQIDRWQPTDRQMFRERTLVRRDGAPPEVVEDWVRTRNLDRRYLAGSDKVARVLLRPLTSEEFGREDPVARIRRLHEAGVLRHVRDEQVDGRDAAILVGEIDGLRWTYVIDKDDYLPIEVRHRRASAPDAREVVERYAVYERLPRDPSSERWLELDPPSGVKEDR